MDLLIPMAMTSLIPRKTLLPFLLSIVVAAGSLAACAHGGDREEPPDRAREMETRTEGSTAEAEAEATVVTPPRVIDRDRGVAIDTGAGTPQRKASLRVVEEGRGYLLAGRTREAAERFQRATRMDPTNGFAYYWMGRARIAAGDANGAVGYLQKAETLLGPYPEWRQQAADLLASLGAR